MKQSANGGSASADFLRPARPRLRVVGNTAVHQSEKYTADGDRSYHLVLCGLSGDRYARGDTAPVTRRIKPR
jgi:hypothetical protein